VAGADFLDVGGVSFVSGFAAKRAVMNRAVVLETHTPNWEVAGGACGTNRRTYMYESEGVTALGHS